ncbi:hypothetical protein E2562_033830, partial [Oryza meyeriana var. granulata]
RRHRDDVGGGMDGGTKLEHFIGGSTVEAGGNTLESITGGSHEDDIDECIDDTGG